MISLSNLLKEIKPYVLGWINDTTAVIHTRQTIFIVPFDVAVKAWAIRIPNKLGVNVTISKVALAVGTAPTGAALIVDILKGGVTIFTNPANRPQIAAGATAGETTTIDIPAWNANEYLTVTVAQIGSTIPGADLSVSIVAS